MFALLDAHFHTLCIAMHWDFAEINNLKFILKNVNSCPKIGVGELLPMAAVT
jgi:hypothetical protein